MERIYPATARRRQREGREKERRSFPKRHRSTRFSVGRRLCLRYSLSYLFILVRRNTSTPQRTKHFLPSFFGKIKILFRSKMLKYCGLCGFPEKI